MPASNFNLSKAPPGSKPRCSDGTESIRLTRIAHDADEHAHNLSRWEQRYDQFSFGCFEGRVTELWLPGLQVFLESANQALQQSCAAWPDAFWVGIPCTPANTLRIDSQPIPDNTLLLRPGGEPFELHTPQNASILGIVVGRELLGHQLAHVEAVDTAVLNHQGALRVPATRYQELSQTLLSLLNLPPGHPAAHTSPGTLRDIILEQLGAAIAAGMPPTGNRHTLHLQQGRRLVNEACEQALSHAGQRLSIADLCRELHVSRRTLQYAFQETTGLAPLAYLRTLKLNQVRRTLRSPQSLAHPVTSAATRWGFDHLGQFSQDYRKLFGESPSTTLYGSRR